MILQMDIIGQIFMKNLLFLKKTNENYMPHNCDKRHLLLRIIQIAH